MIQPSIPSSIRINGKIELPLKNHEILQIKIVKKISNQKWAVSIKGKIFPAISDLKFKPGDTALVKILQQGDQLLLKIQEPQSNLINHVIKQFQLPDHPLIQEIISSLLNEEMKLSLKNINSLVKAMDKLNKKDTRSLKHLIILLKKGIDPNFENLPFFLDLLNWGNNDNTRHKEQSKLHEKKSISDRKELIQKIKSCFTPNNIEESSPLSLFNGLKEGNPFWIFIPYEFQFKNIQFKGSFRILWDNYKNSFDKWIVFIYIDNSEVQIAINPHQEGYRLSLNCEDDSLRKKISKGLQGFQKNVKDLKLEINNDFNEEIFFSSLPSNLDTLQYKPINQMT